MPWDPDGPRRSSSNRLPTIVRLQRMEARPCIAMLKESMTLHTIENTALLTRLILTEKFTTRCDLANERQRSGMHVRGIKSDR